MMPSKPPKISVVIPLRDAEHRIIDEVHRVLEALTDLSKDRCEVIIVDDGSIDSTPELLDELSSIYPQLRLTRHRKPRGIEAAGQTGLEKATGEIVFIQEDNRPIRLEDMRRLYRMADDQTIVAARAESKPRPLSGALLRRLRAWGTQAAETVEAETASEPTSLQMVRRPHLQHLSGPAGRNTGLTGEVLNLTSVS